MSSDKDNLEFALSYAMAVLENKRFDADVEAKKQGYGAGTTLLTQPQADEEVFSPIEAAIDESELFKAVRGKVLYSGNAGIVLHPGVIAPPLFFRAETNLKGAIDWLFRLLQTQETKGLFCAAIWGLAVTKEIPLPDGAVLLPFSMLPDSRLKAGLQRRAKKSWDKDVWTSQAWFDDAGAAYVRPITNFPYIRSDTASFDVIAQIGQEIHDLWALIQAAVVGQPMAFGAWFEYPDRDLDIASRDNFVSWSVPEVAPKIQEHKECDVECLNAVVAAFAKLDRDFHPLMLRSMNRFVLSQCRREVVDRVLDLTLAFETLVSGDGSYAPPGWKVSVRSAQGVGGALEKRLEHREKVNSLYGLRNKASHGSGLSGVKEGELNRILGEAREIYVLLLRSLLRLGKQPNWDSIELEALGH